MECLPGSVEVEDISNAITDNPRINTSSSIAVTEVWVTKSHLLVVCCEATNEDASVASRYLSGAKC